MSTIDRRHLLRAMFGVSAAAACGLPATAPAEAAALPLVKPATGGEETSLLEQVASRRRRRRRVVIRRPRGRLVIRLGPRRRRRRRCFINRRGNRVCVWRRW